MDEYKISTAEPVEPPRSPAVEGRTSAFHAVNLEAKTAVHGGTLKKLSLLIIAATSFLLPIAFWGTTTVYTVKMGLLLIIDALLICGFLASLFAERKLSLPKAKFILPLLLMPLSLVISSLWSGSFVNSFFGNTIEVGTTASMVVLALLSLGSLSSFSKFKPQALLAKAYLLSASLLTVHFFLVTMMYRGILTPVSGFPILLAGSYVDLAILLAGAVLVSVFVLKEKRNTLVAALLWVLCALSLFVIGAVGARAVEIFLALALLLDYLSQKKVSKLSLVSFVAALGFAVLGSTISAPLSSALKVNSLDIKPTLSATAGVLLNEWKHNLVLGAGPNRFVESWAMYKPASINLSDFWGQDFFFGSSIFTTLAVTGGLLFALLTLWFAVSFVGHGLKALVLPASSEKRLAVSSFLFAAFLWAFLFVYNPGITVLALAFMATAVFAQSLASANLIRYSDLSLGGRYRLVLLAVLTLVLAAGVGYTEILSWKKIQAADLFAKTIVQYQQKQELAQAEAGLVQANTLAPADLYERTLSNVYLIDITNKISSLKTDAVNEQKETLQKEVNAAVGYAQLATLYNPDNYLNHLAQAKVYEQLAYQKVQGALESAQIAYHEAEKRNPSNPSIQLAFARLAALEGDAAKAKEYANKSVELKPNYSAAYYLLAQLEAAGNNVQQAIGNVEKAAASDPNNAGLFFQLGLIKYNTKDFAGAAQALERSIQLIPEYANAKYFLGLSYFYRGDKEGAIKQFQEIEETNPGNAEVKLILTNLQAGRDPFANAKPPVDKNPGKRKTPPVENN